MFLPQSSSRRFRRDRQMLSQRHEDTKEDWSIWQYKIAVVESILFSASLPLDLRAFVPSCEALLIGGTNGGGKRTKRDTACVRMGSCNLNSCVDLSTKRGWRPQSIATHWLSTQMGVHEQPEQILCLFEILRSFETSSPVQGDLDAIVRCSHKGTKTQRKNSSRQSQNPWFETCFSTY